MYKNLVILGCCVLVILPITLFVMVEDHQYHNNPNLVRENEVQSCKVDSDCVGFYSSCGSNYIDAISISNLARYSQLQEQYCENNKPNMFYHFSNEKQPMCIANLCKMAGAIETSNNFKNENGARDKDTKTIARKL